MIDYTALYRVLSAHGWASQAENLKQAVDKALHEINHGDQKKWLTVLNELPRISASTIDLKLPTVQIGTAQDADEQSIAAIENLLHQLHPWRKGPFNLFGIKIDTEWRSDFKWDRLKDHIHPLANRTVLDIGCGSGYHCWRMAGAGAKLVVGIDPTLLYVMQFYAMQTYCQASNVFVLPLSTDELPGDIDIFDTVFSMGILYHRRSPMDHLYDLKRLLKPGGELVLETLVIDGDIGQTLVPEGRYAQMRNVWFIPTPQTLLSWLTRCGFKQARVVDVTKTTYAEQRSTAWMRFESLKDFLNPANDEQTIEGLPAPLRAVIIANN